MLRERWRNNIRLTTACALLIASTFFGCNNLEGSSSNTPTLAESPMPSPNSMPWDDWGFESQQLSGNGPDSIVVTVDGNYPRLVTFTFTGSGWHWANMYDANIGVGTKQNRASAVWDPLFGNSTTLKVEGKGPWTMTIQPLSMAPTWYLPNELLISNDQSVYTVVDPRESGDTLTSIVWRAEGCPVTTKETRVWMPGGGGINGWWKTNPSKKRGAFVYLNWIYANGQIGWGLGVSTSISDSQTSSYNGAAKARNNIVGVIASTNCKKLIIDQGPST
jgi:hypothetical protein